MTAEARAIHRELLRLRSLRQAAILQRFFKTGPGEYGEGDRFLGIKVPVLRGVVRTHPDAGRAEAAALLSSKYHEARLVALLLLVEDYRRAGRNEQAAIVCFYLSHTERINNWDLVDLSAPNIVGAWLRTRSRRVLRRLARSRSLWERRIAIVATQAFIREGDFGDTLRIAAMLRRDPHDLIHKAVGWMLREVGKRDRACLEHFLAAHYRHLPRTTLRYAIERLPEPRRRAYLLGTV